MSAAAGGGGLVGKRTQITAAIAIVANALAEAVAVLAGPEAGQAARQVALGLTAMLVPLMVLFLGQKVDRVATVPSGPAVVMTGDVDVTVEAQPGTQGAGSPPGLVPPTTSSTAGTSTPRA